MLDVILAYRGEAQTTAAWLICLAALKWGGGPERAIALIWLAVFELGHRGYHLLWNPIFQVDRFDTYHAMQDLVVLLGFVMVALRANLMYPLWIAAFQLIAFSAHLARGIADQITPIAYAALVIGPSYFQLGLIAGGLALHMRRVRKSGPYRDWTQGSGNVGWQAFLSMPGRRA